MFIRGQMTVEYQRDYHTSVDHICNTISLGRFYMVKIYYSRMPSSYLCQYGMHLPYLLILLFHSMYVCHVSHYRFKSVKGERRDLHYHSYKQVICDSTLSKGARFRKTRFWVIGVQSQTISKYGPKVDFEISYILESSIFYSLARRSCCKTVF